MPFNFSKYSSEVRDMSFTELEKEKQRYTHAGFGTVISTGISVLSLGPLAPISLCVTAATGVNANQKLKIIDQELSRRGRQVKQRRRDWVRGGLLNVTTGGLCESVTFSLLSSVACRNGHCLYPYEWMCKVLHNNGFEYVSGDIWP